MDDESEKLSKKKPVVGDGTPGPGRKKGVPNKATIQIKDMVAAALDGVGGKDYLMRQANENPAAFLSLVGKTIPKDIRADVGVSHSLDPAGLPQVAEWLVGILSDPKAKPD